jgi:5-formyltetrahydrofolate cyclo-ligase
MFIPFVGVDSNGKRLGYGGGYFDSSLEIFKSTREKPLIVGLGYDYQVSDEVYGEEHDLKYDLVITEKRILSFV